MEILFESENIFFIKPSLEHVPDYLEMVNDIEHVARFIGERRKAYTEQEERAYVQEKIDGGAAMYTMIEKSTGRFIGNTEFFRRVYREAEWGIAITASMQDKGFGTEALKRMIDYGMNDLGLERIYISVYKDNLRALHVYEKCGFKEYNRNDTDVFMELFKNRR